MTTQIAFLIWLYERENDLSYDSKQMERHEAQYIRERYMEFFGIDKDFEESLKKMD